MKLLIISFSICFANGSLSLSAIAESARVPLSNRQGVEENDSSLTVLIQESLAREDAGDLDGAIELHKRIVEMRSNATRSLIAIAGLYGKKGDFNAEVHWAQRAIAINPKDFTAYINLGNGFAGLGQLDKAEESFKKSGELDAKSPLPSYSLGCVEEQKENYNKAIEFYSQSVRLDPEFATGRFSLAAMYANIKEYDKAETELKEVLRLTPEAADAKAMLKSIQARNPGAEHNNAIDLYNEALKFSRQGDYASALPLLTNACSLNAENPSIQINLGLALLHQGQTDEAIKHLLIATKMQDCPLVGWKNLGAAYEESDEIEKAILAFQKYMLLIPAAGVDAAGAKRHLEALQEIIHERQRFANSKDYFDPVGDCKACRWSEKRMPIKIFIGVGDSIAGYQPEYGLAVRQAFEQWAKASGGKIRIEYVPDNNSAGIAVNWTSNISSKDPAAAGQAELIASDNEGATKASVILCTHDIYGRNLTANRIARQSIHEIGHALGIWKHSPFHEDLMYYFEPYFDSAPKFTQRDLGTVRKLYASDS